MYKLIMLLSGAAALSTPLFAQENGDSIVLTRERDYELDEVVVVAKRPAIRQEPDRIVYMVKNDPYAAGLDGIELLDRIPRVSVINDLVSVAGKNSVRYIIDGHLLEMTDESITMKLKTIQAAGVEKIELITTPPAKYSAAGNVAYISITTRNESLGTRGNLWGQSGRSDHFRYSLGGNVCHTTRKVELSADMGWNDSKGRNDIYKQYDFADYTRVSDRATSFVWRTLSANTLFKYKLDMRLSIGAMVNFSSNRMDTEVKDMTITGNVIMNSISTTPSYPDDALTLTGFADWKIDSQGKMMSLTYNFFDKESNSFSDVVTECADSKKSRLTKEGENSYKIHSAKLDVTLPLSTLKVETGGAYTAISNNTNLAIANEIGGALVNDPSQSNRFRYDEKTAAVYLSGEKNFGNLFYGKVALRYEHTDVRGNQESENMRFDRSSDYIFPTVNLSRNFTGAGRLSADYSMGISRPIFGDLNPFRYYNTVKDYFTGNPNLKSVLVQNAGVNYSYKGLYAVAYVSWSRNAVGYITRFESDGMQWTTPENCLNTFKTGIYASYNRELFDWWNIKVGGEVFYGSTRSNSGDFKDTREYGYGGKAEVNTSWMLNRAKSLILNLRCTHFFPYHDRMAHYFNRTIIGCELRYMMLDNRLVLTASLNDPFGWSVTRSTARYKNYSLYSRTDIHNHSVAIKAIWSFGGRKVNNVYRDSKERESQRSY